MPLSRNINGIEAKYTRGDLTVTDLTTIPEITEADWDTALELDVAVVIPRERSLPIRASMVFPGNGIYKVFFRIHNNVGNIGPITSAGIFEVDEVDPRTARIQAAPAWEGTAQNMVVWTHGSIRRLFTDPENHRAVTLNNWNGVGGGADGIAWPFGNYPGLEPLAEDATHTRYTTRELDFGSLRRVEIFVSYTVTEPPTLPEQVRANPSDETTFDLTLLHSPTSLSTNALTISARNGRRIEVTTRYIQARVRFRLSRRSVLTNMAINWRFLDS